MRDADDREGSDPVTSPDPTRPVILGGGFAGIAAAVSLADQGARPILVESRPFLGGRARSFLHEGSGEEIDNGQHLLMGCYTATLALLEKLGTRHLVDVQSGLSVELRDESGPRPLRARTSLPAPLDVLVGMLLLERITVAERCALLRAGVGARTGRPRPLESVSAWLDRQGQSARLKRLLWHPLVIATMNTSPHDASAELFLTLLRLSFLKGGPGGSLAFPRVGLSRLIDPAADYIRGRGGDVMTGTTIMRVTREADGSKEGQGSWRVYGRNLELTTNRLISALPWHRFADLFGSYLPDELQRAVPAPDHNPILSLYLWYDRPLPQVPRFVALVGTGIEWVFNRRKISPVTSPRYPGLLSCVVSNAGEIGDDGEFVERAVREIRERIPEIGDARPVDHLIIREKRATFAATPEIEGKRIPPGPILPGLEVYGDWTATDLPGTIEGAVRSWSTERPITNN